jgi:hypothetical protein
MLKEEIVEKLDKHAGQYGGRIGKQKFGVDSGPFEESDHSFAAYLIGNYSGDFYFDSAEEFLNGFIIYGLPIG